MHTHISIKGQEELERLLNKGNNGISPNAALLRRVNSVRNGGHTPHQAGPTSFYSSGVPPSHIQPHLATAQTPPIYQVPQPPLVPSHISLPHNAPPPGFLNPTQPGNYQAPSPPSSGVDQQTLREYQFQMQRDHHVQSAAPTYQNHIPQAPYTSGQQYNHVPPIPQPIPPPPLVAPAVYRPPPLAQYQPPPPVQPVGYPPPQQAPYQPQQQLQAPPRVLQQNSERAALGQRLRARYAAAAAAAAAGHPTLRVTGQASQRIRPPYGSTRRRLRSQNHVGKSSSGETNYKPGKTALDKLVRQLVIKDYSSVSSTDTGNAVPTFHLSDHGHDPEDLLDNSEEISVDDGVADKQDELDIYLGSLDSSLGADKYQNSGNLYTGTQPVVGHNTVPLSSSLLITNPGYLGNIQPHLALQQNPVLLPNHLHRPIVLPSHGVALQQHQQQTAHRNHILQQRNSALNPHAAQFNNPLLFQQQQQHPQQQLLQPHPQQLQPHPQQLQLAAQQLLRRPQQLQRRPQQLQRRPQVQNQQQRQQRLPQQRRRRLGPQRRRKTSQPAHDEVDADNDSLADAADYQYHADF